MIILKYESFFESEDKEKAQTKAEILANITYFEYESHTGDIYKLKVFPQFNLFSLVFPDGLVMHCAYSAFKKNIDYLRTFEEGGVALWILKNIVKVQSNNPEEPEDKDKLTDLDVLNPE